jgi:hypothetical protein
MKLVTISFSFVVMILFTSSTNELSRKQKEAFVKAKVVLLQIGNETYGESIMKRDSSGKIVWYNVELEKIKEAIINSGRILCDHGPADLVITIEGKMQDVKGDYRSVETGQVKNFSTGTIYLGQVIFYTKGAPTYQRKYRFQTGGNDSVVNSGGIGASTFIKSGTNYDEQLLQMLVEIGPYSLSGQK